VKGAGLVLWVGFDSFFVNIQCATACLLEKVNFKI